MTVTRTPENVMRIAIISDIHSNKEALESVLAECDSAKIEEIVCLGDIVGYGANPNECVQRIRTTCSLTLIGNHDAAAINLLTTENFNPNAKIAIDWTSEELTTEAHAYLRSLPFKKVCHDTTFVHASPFEPHLWHYITGTENIAIQFDHFTTQFCFIGHTHIPGIIANTPSQPLNMMPDTALEWGTMPGVRFLINVGSVGQPRDHDPRACFGILDTDQHTFELRRVPYNITGAQACMRKVHFPDALIHRLSQGV
jgi:diadenosine tetraphosphatase ApaH/serine/threonine PP2A family protein phosphatase